MINHCHYFELRLSVLQTHVKIWVSLLPSVNSSADIMQFWQVLCTATNCCSKVFLSLFLFSLVIVAVSTSLQLIRLMRLTVRCTNDRYFTHSISLISIMKHEDLRFSKYFRIRQSWFLGLTVHQYTDHTICKNWQSWKYWQFDWSCAPCFNNLTKPGGNRVLRHFLLILANGNEEIFAAWLKYLSPLQIKLDSSYQAHWHLIWVFIYKVPEGWHWESVEPVIRLEGFWVW